MADPPVEQNNPPWINPDNLDYDKAPAESSTRVISESIPYFVEDFLQTLIDVHWRTTVPGAPPCIPTIQSYLPMAGYSNHSVLAVLDWGEDPLRTPDQVSDGDFLLNFASWVDPVTHVTRYGWTSWTLGTGVNLGSLDMGGIFFGLGASNQQGVLYSGSGSSNFCPVNAINETSLLGPPELAWSYGENSGFGPPGHPGMVNATNNMFALHANATWILGSTLTWMTLNNGQTGVNIAGGLMTGAPWHLTDGSQASICGQVLTQQDPITLVYNCATAYILNYPPLTIGHVGVHAVSVSDGGTSGGTTSVPITNAHRIGQFVPSDIDPDWTGLTFNAVNGFSGDNTPGFAGLITCVSVKAADAPTWAYATVYAEGARINYGGKVYISLHDSNSGHIPPNTLQTWWRAVQMQYCAKIATGGADVSTPGAISVSWVVPIDAMISPDKQSSQSRVQNGLYALFQLAAAPTGSTKVYIINTKDGKFLTQPVQGISFGALGQAWDDTSNSVVFFGAYNSAVPGAPEGRNGTASCTRQWLRYWLCLDKIPP